MATDESLEEPVDADALASRIARAKARRRRGWKIAGALAAGTLGLLVAAYFVVDAVDRQAGEAAIQRVRDAGDPVTPQELAEFYTSSPDIERATQHWRAAFVDTEAWNATVGNMPVVGDSKLKPELDERGFYTPAAVARIRPFLDGPAAPKLREIRLAREAGAVARFPAILNETDFDKATAHFQELRQLGNLLSLRRQVQESEGDFAGAAETIVDLVAVSEALTNEPTNTSYLARIAIHGVAAYEAIDSLSRCPHDEQSLRAIQEAFARQDLHASLLHTMRGQQASVLQAYDLPAVGDEDLEWARTLPFRGGDRAMAVEWFQTYLEGAEGGWAEMAQAAEEAVARTHEIERSGYLAYRYLVAISLTPNPLMYLRAAQRGQTDANVVVAFAACRRYRLANGEWPESLDELVPEYLAAVPIDPVAAQPLDYEREGDMIRFRTAIYTTELTYLDLPYLDPVGRHVFDAASFEPAE